MTLVRQRKFYDIMHAPRKGFVDVLTEIAREDDAAAVLFDLLQQIGHFDVSVPVMCVLSLGTLAEKRIGFVKEKYRVAALGGAKDTVEILLRLANGFADQTGE